MGINDIILCISKKSKHKLTPSYMLDIVLSTFTCIFSFNPHRTLWSIINIPLLPAKEREVQKGETLFPGHTGNSHSSRWPTPAALLRSTQHQPQRKVSCWAISCCSTHAHWQAWPKACWSALPWAGPVDWKRCGSGNRGWLRPPDLWWRKWIPSLILRSLSWRNRGSQKGIESSWLCSWSFQSLAPLLAPLVALGELWDSALWVRWSHYWDSYLSVGRTWVNETSPLKRFSHIGRFLLSGLSLMARGKVYTGQRVSAGKFLCKQILFNLYPIFLFCEIMPYFEGWSNSFLDINIRAFCFLRKKVQKLCFFFHFLKSI